MSALTEFEISLNSFEGALPESGFQVMRAAIAFNISSNRFKGMLPEVTMSTVTGLEAVYTGFEI
eukprot:2264445-Amphidinium_carterae.1